MTGDAIDDCLDATPAEIEAEQRRLAALDAEIVDFQRRGWHWNRAIRVLTHPDHPEATTWIDPYTGQKFLSPKLVELLRELLSHDNAVGAAVEQARPHA